MPRREFDEVWDRDLMKQQLGEMRKESVRLKRELARAMKVQEQTWREASELRRLVQEKWPGMVVTVFTGWAYAGIAASLQPNGSHILFLVYTKVVLPAWLCLQDSLNVGIHLRVTKAGFEEALGKQGKEASQKTRKMWGMLLSWSFIILVDLLRHFKTPPLLRRR